MPAFWQARFELAKLYYQTNGSKRAEGVEGGTRVFAKGGRSVADAWIDGRGVFAPGATGRRAPRRCRGGEMRAAIAALCALTLVAQSPSPPVAVRFVDEALHAGIHLTLQNHATPEKHQVEAMPAGVAVLEFDNDGFEDLYFVNGADMPDLVKTSPADWNRLYPNNGDGTFRDVTRARRCPG
jgi:hypothetical protein